MLYCKKPDRWRKTLTSGELVKAPGREIVEVPGGVMLPLRWISGSQTRYADGLLEGGVLDAQNNFVAGLDRSLDSKLVNRTCAQGYSFDASELETRNDNVVYGGVLAGAWGHMLVDATSRLWFVREARKRGLKVVFLIIPGQKLEHPELLRLAGLQEDDYEIINQPTRFKSITVPASSVFLKSGHFTNRWLETFDTMRENALAEIDHSSEWPTKIYLSRAQYKYQNIVGENYFERFFIDRGYQPIYLEKLPLAEQVATLAYAESVATTMGTLAHMALFCQDDTELIILNRSRTVVDTQAVINNARKLRCTLVDTFASFLPDRQTTGCPVLLAPGPEWNEFIHNRFNAEPDNQYRENEFPQYVVDYLRKWGAFYTGSWAYGHIRNCDIREIVAHTNEVFNEQEIDTSGLPEPTELVSLRAEVARLRFRLEKLESTSEPYVKNPRNRIAPIGNPRLDVVSWEGGMLAFGGMLTLSEEAAHTENAMQAAIVLMASGRTESLNNIKLDTRAMQGIAWSTAITKRDVSKALNRLYTKAPFKSVKLAFELTAEDGSYDIIPLGIDYSEAALQAFRGHNIRFGIHLARARWYRNDTMRFDIVSPKQIAAAAKKRLS